MSAHDHDLDDFDDPTPYDDDVATDQEAADDPWEGGKVDEAPDSDRRAALPVIIAALIAAALLLTLVVALG